MNKTMTAIADATRLAIATRGDGKPFHRHISGRGYYRVKRDMPREGYDYEQEPGTVTVYHYGTCVASISLDGTITLDRGGGGPTTKNVINAALSGAGTPLQVCQVRGEWHVENWKARWPSDYPEHADFAIRRFQDGMTISPETLPAVGYTFTYPWSALRCRYDFGIIGVYHGVARDDLGGMCESCRGS